MIPVFYGFDPREEVGAHTFCSSVIHHTSKPVALIPVRAKQRDGSNAFTYARFQVPAMQWHEGWAIFCDGSDMVVLDDIVGLWNLRDDSKAVLVAPHDYKTRHARKYVGTPMEAGNEDYPRKNWSSVMLINCQHPGWRIDPSTMTGPQLHRFSFLDPAAVGFLPLEWNWLVDEYGQNDKAKLLHWTAGIPAIPHYIDAPSAWQWHRAHQKVNRLC